MTTHAHGRWEKLRGERTGFIDRCEKFAGYTIPRLCLPDGYAQNDTSLRHDWQSVGAQGTNHLANRLMLSLFAPSRPFARYDPSPALKAALASQGISETKLAEALSVAEKDAVKKLDQIGARPKLFEIAKHLIVTGNALMLMGKDNLRAFGIKRYVVKRAHDGKVMEAMVQFPTRVSELDPEAQAALAGFYKDDQKVNLYHWIKRRPNGDYEMDQWVDEQKLPQSFSGKWNAERFPYVFLTWDLAEGDDYGTGLVELYEGDFAALSALTEAQITAALLATEFRWMVNPAGLTKPEDLAASRNGDALPGNKDDITPLETGKMSDLSVIGNMGQEYIRRIGNGFLLMSSTIRDSERTTAEEVRMQANELETGLGGVYSRLSVDWQMPMAYWLARMAKIDIGGQAIEPTIVTGMEALSRSSDRDNLVQFLSDCAAIGNLPEDIRRLVKVRNVLEDFAAARNIPSTRYLLSEDEERALSEQEAQAALEAQAGEAMINEGARGAAQ